MIEEHFDKAVLNAVEKTLENSENVILPRKDIEAEDRRYVVNTFLMDFIKNLKDDGVIRVEVLHK